jgi:hypothetical protein
MIHRLTIRNFKSIHEQTYDFSEFDLLVGRNNSGKSTILQALAIWQFCVNEFHRAKRGGSTGKQVVLPNFTALPVPEFNLLWRERTEREYPLVNGTKKQEYILIEIEVAWRTKQREERVFGVKLRYNSPQSVYAIPSDGWERFRALEQEGSIPVIAYVPPFSGLEPIEEWRDDGPLRKQVGKAQPGSVLRNLLLRVCPPALQDQQVESERNHEPPADWKEIKNVVRRWFSVELSEPKYERGVDTQIVCEYKQDKRPYDIIAAGSGFHQTLTLLAFLYGYHPTTILLDEPDAHLHVNLQREILDYFKRKSSERGVQFLIATHAEEFVKGVDPTQLVSLMSQRPTRVESTPGILTAMADVSNTELTELMASPVMLYVEGESDERILRAWAKACDSEDIFPDVCFRAMGGGAKLTMKDEADRHFAGVTQVIPHAKRLMLFDYDADAAAFHPGPDNPALYEWKRANIENYLLVPEAWERAGAAQVGPLFAASLKKAVHSFFAAENLTLPQGQSWRTVSANVFTVVHGKRLLFEGANSLFHRLRQLEPSVELIRETVAVGMTADEIHNDVHGFFAKLRKTIVSLKKD